MKRIVLSLAVSSSLITTNAFANEDNNMSIITSQGKLMQIRWFLNNNYKEIIPNGFSGKVFKLGTWWGDHSVKLDINNDNSFDFDFDDNYPNDRVEDQNVSLSFDNGFSLEDYEQWTSYWVDDTHGEVKCWASDCSYNPSGAGAIMIIEDTKFSCTDNLWKYDGNLVNNEELYCKEYKVPSDIVKLFNTTSSQESIIYENENLTGISNAKLINDKVVVGFGELGTPKSGYPTEQNWYSLYMMNGSEKITIDNSTNAVNANELSISNIDNDIAVAYQKPTGSSYGFDSPFKIYTNSNLTTDEMIFTNSNWGCCTSIDVDSQGNTHVIQFAHSGYFLNYSTNVSGSWINDNISGYSTYYHYPKLTLDKNDIPHIVTSQLNDNYGTKGVMQHWTSKSGSWDKETIATDSNGHGKLILDGDNNIYGTYVDTNDNLKLILKVESDNWSSEIIANGLDIRGRETRVALSNDNKIYVVAKNNDSDKVYIFTKNDTQWDTIILNDNLTPTTNDNSKAPSILFDTNNNPIIIYADDTKIYKYLLNNDSNNSTNICTQQITYAKNPKSGTWYPFNTPCDVPENWETNTTKPIDFNSTSIGLPPETTLDENTVTIFTAGFKAGKNYVLNNLNEFNTTIISTITSDKIDSLNTGWHLMGTSTLINNLDIFNNAQTIWKYNNGWEAYSPNNTIQLLINNNNDIGILKSIEEDKGFWINK